MKINNLTPFAGELDGSEPLPTVKSGSKKITTAQVAALGQQVGMEGAAVLAAVYSAFDAEDGAEKVSTKYPEPGSKKRTFAEVATKEIELSGFTGADPTSATDSYAAFMNFAAAVKSRKATGIVDGAYRIHGLGRPAPTIGEGEALTLQGRDSRMGNISNGTLHASSLYFDQNAPVAILVNEGQLTIDRVAVIGGSRANTNAGIKTIGNNCGLRLKNGAVVQGFENGWDMAEGYYHDVDDAVFSDCVNSIVISAPPPPENARRSYNFTTRKLKIVAAIDAASTAMKIFNGSRVKSTQSSYESFQSNGVVVGEGSSFTTISDYYEGIGGWNILYEAGAKINALYNHVYLREGASRFISAKDATATGAQIIAQGNEFVGFVGAEAGAAAAYALLNNDPLAMAFIFGDQWPGNPGANMHYIEPTFFSGSGVAGFNGQFDIMFPVNHPRAFRPIRTIPLSLAPAQSAFSGVPAPGTIMAWAANGNPGDDPIALRTANGGAWGAYPYGAIWHQSQSVPDGQWEKIGLRIPNIPAPVGGAVVDVELRAVVVALLAAFEDQGVME